MMNKFDNTNQYFKQKLRESKQSIEEERIIISKQSSIVKIKGGRKVINLCSNNYLGLSDNSKIIKAAKKTLDKRGFGMSSVRFICGTQDIHLKLENLISNFFKTEETILYSSCFDANCGLFETILGINDLIFSDELNHASIIDGMRLCKSTKYRYKNNDMNDLEKKLKRFASTKKSKKGIAMIATDGVFSMNGVVVNLKKIVELSKEYNSIIMIDESHSTGCIGNYGRGITEYYNLLGKIDVITGTLGKALGGASGGFITGKKEIIDILRKKSRPYLFSNSLAPVIVGASIKVFKILTKNKNLQNKLQKNTKYFHKKLKDINIKTTSKIHPIIPLRIKHPYSVNEISYKFLKKDIYVIGFSYPVVPKTKPIIRFQISSKHNKKDLKIVIKTIKTFQKKFNCFEQIEKK
jgi:glycine C-acetyltransferase